MIRADPVDSGRDPSCAAIHSFSMDRSADVEAEATLRRYENRLARGLAHVVNLLDPDVIVLGGGLSNLDRLYVNVPAIWNQWVFSDRVDTRLHKAKHGDSSGVRGAAWLWPPEG